MSDNPFYLRKARELTANQRDLLIAHVDGSSPITDLCLPSVKYARHHLIAKGLVTRGRTRSKITEDGRGVLAACLGDLADALVRAGYTGFSSPARLRPSEEDKLAG